MWMKIVGIVLLIVLPLVWGLMVEFIFEHIRRKTRGTNQRGKSANPNQQEQSPYDWII